MKNTLNTDYLRVHISLTSKTNFCLRLSKFLTLAVLLVQFEAFAQLIPTTGQTALQLANIIAGPGVTVSNAQIIGNPEAIGAFTTGATATNLGMAEGVVMASGYIVTNGGNTGVNAPGASFASGWMNTPGDPFLAATAGVASNDAVILEFDFVPNSDFVQFKYVFGSEEYPEWVCSSFNDMFAFTITGVTVPMPQTNIALIPGTAIPVSINTVNDDPTCGGDYSAYYIDNQGGAHVVYDGITVVLTAESQVICGETYRLRLMLSDGGDTAFDSGCFIEANSLTTGNVTVSTTTAAADDFTYEGCSNATVTLTLNGPPFVTDFYIPIWIEPTSTASWGLDYDPIAAFNLADSTILLPAGQNTVTFTIDPINDNLSEGPEFIDFVVITSTCGLTQTFRIYIADMVPITIGTSNDTTICTGNAVTWALGFGGGGVYTYNWSNNMGTNDTILPMPPATTVYTVTVTDQCGSAPAQASVTVTVDDGPGVNAGNDVGVCNGAFVVLNGSTDTPGAVFSWSPPTFLSATSVSNPICTPTAPTTYVLTVTRADGCYNRDTVLVDITPPPTSDFNLPIKGCVGQPVVIQYTGNANASGQYNWQFQSGQTLFGNNMGPYSVLWNAPGTYDVSLTVAWNGCISAPTTQQIEIIASPIPFAGVDVAYCPGGNALLGSPAVTGETYVWSPIFGLDNPNIAQPTATLNNITNQAQSTTYTVTATNAACSAQDSVRVTVFATPTAEFASPAGECFATNSFDLTATGFFGPGASFDWQFGPLAFPQSSTQQNVNGLIFNEPGTYPVTLVITDNGCISQPYTGNITVHGMPVAEFISNDPEGCAPHYLQFINQSVGPSAVLYSSWDFGDGTGSTDRDPQYTYPDAGMYNVTLTVSTPQGCSNSRTRASYITIHPKPNAQFTVAPQVMSILDPQVTATNTAQGISSSHFFFDGTGHDEVGNTVSHTYQDTGTYRITQIVETEFGCLDTTLFNVKVEPNYALWIPNAFTPNGDGINPIFAADGDGIAEFYMAIYNRWGSLIFESWDITKGWDGSVNGRQVPLGKYLYVVEVTDILGNPHKYNGTFHLTR